MKRFDPSNKHEDGMAPRTDGEWVRYSDHVEAMKRIAGEGERITPIAASFCRAYDEVNGPIPRAAAPAAPVAQGLTDEQVDDVIAAVSQRRDLSFADNWEKCRAEVRAILATSPESQAHLSPDVSDAIAGHIMAELEDRKGILDDVGCDIRQEIREAIASIIHRTVLTQSAVTEPLQGTQEPSASAQQADRECSGREWWLHALPGSELAVPSALRKCQKCGSLEHAAGCSGTYVISAPAASPAALTVDEAEEMVRFCPECGSLGNVPAPYQTCCPDASHARIVPKRFAEICRDTFRLLVDKVDSNPIGIG